MATIASGSIDLVVTSPPYPMIEMWDALFSDLNPAIKKALATQDGNAAFELMHRQLDSVWKEVCRVLRTGGFACINIGDAVRTIDGKFQLYPNHIRILNYFYQQGFSPLPAVIWRKQTNAPNKFMGSGMLPAGAYITLEHEYVLILRKGEKRRFDTVSEKLNRQRSALFWEERNQWFSDVWMDLKGARQKMADDQARRRSGAFPFELPYRLIQMYSVQQDTVLDPFLGIGTTMLAAMASARSSIGFEMEKDFFKPIKAQIDSIVDFSNQCIQDRLNSHRDFVERHIGQKGGLKHENRWYGFPVVTNQEKELFIPRLTDVKGIKGHAFEVGYQALPVSEDGKFPDKPPSGKTRRNTDKFIKPPVQQLLFGKPLKKD